MLFEVLVRRWGFYFPCAVHNTVSPYGSFDLARLLDDIGATDGFNFLVPLSGRGSGKKRQDLEANRRVVRRLIDRIFLARLMIFKLYCAMFTKAGIPESVARRRWLLLQLRPSELVKSDLFTGLASELQDMDDIDVSSHIQSCLSECSVKLDFIALDESQVAVHSYAQAFASAKMTTHAPVLRELLICIGSRFPEQRILIAGTDVPQQMVDEAMSHSDSSDKRVSFFHDLGQFDRLERTRAYVRHFFGDAISADVCADAHQWLRGR